MLLSTHTQNTVIAHSQEEVLLNINALIWKQRMRNTEQSLIYSNYENIPDWQSKIPLPWQQLYFLEETEFSFVHSFLFPPILPYGKIQSVSYIPWAHLKYALQGDYIAFIVHFLPPPSLAILRLFEVLNRLFFFYLDNATFMQQFHEKHSRLLKCHIHVSIITV